MINVIKPQCLVSQMGNIHKVLMLHCDMQWLPWKNHFVQLSSKIISHFFCETSNSEN